MWFWFLTFLVSLYLLFKFVFAPMLLPTSYYFNPTFKFIINIKKLFLKIDKTSDKSPELIILITFFKNRNYKPDYTKGRYRHNGSTPPTSERKVIMNGDNNCSVVSYWYEPSIKKKIFLEFHGGIIV